MFRYRGDALVVACLGYGPLRFTELSNAIMQRAHLHMADAQLGRCLTRLVDLEQLEHVEVDELPVYRLTAAGSRTAAMLLFLNTAAGEHDASWDEGADSRANSSTWSAGVAE
jgi:DNA-binding HxlR family transcriptional regulator